MKALARKIKRRLIPLALDLWWAATHKLFAWRGMLVPIHTHGGKQSTKVDAYWGVHTVNSRPFLTASSSRDYLEWRFSVYPLLKEFMQLHEGHDNQVILDYGCGPGDDVTGFAIHSGAKKIYGCDVSLKALRLTRYRLALHRVNPARAGLFHLSDGKVGIPLDDGCVDFLHCGGVLHHTSRPEDILREFHRVMVPGSKACIMVYNYDSLWLHLYTAYARMILEGAFKGLPLSEAFAKNTDGPECPISRCYPPEDFIGICRSAGFSRVDYAGGYLSDTEMEQLRLNGKAALDDDRLDKEHKDFLSALTYDGKGYPMHKGKHAGIGGVFWLEKM